MLSKALGEARMQASLLCHQRIFASSSFFLRCPRCPCLRDFWPCLALPQVFIFPHKPYVLYSSLNKTFFGLSISQQPPFFELFLNFLSLRLPKHLLWNACVGFCVCCLFSLPGQWNKSSRARQICPVVHLSHPHGISWLGGSENYNTKILFSMRVQAILEPHRPGWHAGSTAHYCLCPWMSNRTSLKLMFFICWM